MSLLSSDIELFCDGGVAETRTLAPVTRPTSLAGTPLHQLGYYSVVLLNISIAKCCFQPLFIAKKAPKDLV